MKTFINLRISGAGLDLQEITTQLPIHPANTGKKGDVIIGQWSFEENTTLQEDFWLGEHRSDEKLKLEENLEHFMMKLKPAAAYLRTLAEKHHVTIWVSAYPENEQANIHISLATINILSEIGATLDCSMAFLKDFYEGNY